MAVSLMMMVGRFSGAMGSNFTAALIYNYCETLYKIYFALILGTAIVTYLILKKQENPRLN